ncbi:hypothetical protein [Actinomadura chokoriensis]|uniref:hypothetical protein n=1 Tax=Actinomadura chokoriensis TaxID=454156 RepID=UPI0031F74727
MNAPIVLWVLVPMALFLVMALYVVSIGYRTRYVDLRTEVPSAEESGRGLSLLTVRGLNEPRT